MKQFITFTTLILLIIALFSCKKDLVEPDNSIPDPADTVMQRNFKLVFENLSGHWNSPKNLTAYVTVETPEKQINLTTPVLFENRCSTPLIKLPKGAYKIQRLIINDDSGTTQFATPVAGSSKAGQITKPLSVSLVLEEKTDKEVRLEVLPVVDIDTPQSFGYPTGAFGKKNGDDQPAMDKRVFIRAQIKVGEILYDNIPAQLIVKSWDAKNEMDYKIHYLAAGTQAIYLSAKAARFHLSVSKWGSYAERTLTQAEVQENALYTIGGQVAGKKLKSVVELKIVDGVSRPQTKTDYEYFVNGEILQRRIWGKKADQSTYLMQKDIFNYTNGNITSIESYDESNTLQKKLTARYDNKGRVVALDEMKGADMISATAGYFTLDTDSGTEQAYRIDVRYRLENGKYTDYYSKTMSGGRTVHDVYVSHNGGREEGFYDFDSSINPYAHLKIPDLLFNQYVRHNMVFPRKQYSGGRPLVEAYDFKYTYDADGYPKELLTKYRSTQTKVDTHVIRTVFTY